jgi:hypothetical protein
MCVCVCDLADEMKSLGKENSVEGYMHGIGVNWERRALESMGIIKTLLGMDRKG